MKKLFEKNDLIVLIIISALAVILLLPHFFGSSSLVAEISVDGEIVKEINLEKVNGLNEFTLDCSPKVKVRAEQNRICIVEADCPDKLCVNCGWLDSDGDMAVCLPAKVVINIKENKQESKNAPDVITY